MTKILKKRWMKIAGIVKEQNENKEEADETQWDEDREKGMEMANKSLKDLKDEGFSDEEILSILKDL